jgi:conjugative transfer signal peptidase TraF
VRAPPLAGIVVALALLVAPSIRQQRPLFIWNASPSVAVGLYRVDQATHDVGDLVVLRLPAGIAALAARRGYLPRSAYLLKPIVAVEGDRVCRFGTHVFVRRRFVTFAHPADSTGRAMPTWHGCRTLKTRQVFVLADHPASFDSRYFGPLDANSIAGRAVLL